MTAVAVFLAGLAGTLAMGFAMAVAGTAVVKVAGWVK